MSTLENLTEADVRALRDKVYGYYGAQPISDKEWDNAARDKWMQPSEIAWLQQQSAKQEARR